MMNTIVSRTPPPLCCRRAPSTPSSSRARPTATTSTRLMETRTRYRSPWPGKRSPKTWPCGWPERDRSPDDRMRWTGSWDSKCCEERRKYDRKEYILTSRSSIMSLAIVLRAFGLHALQNQCDVLLIKVNIRYAGIILLVTVAC